MGLKALSRLIAGAPDYETGLWTPRLGTTTGTDGTHTYSTQVGRYIRIGNLVWAHLHLAVSTLDGAMSGVAAIKDLPFAASNVPGLNVAVTMINVNGITINVAGGYYVVGGRMSPNSTRIEVIEEGNNVPATPITQADLSNATYFTTTAVYSTGLTT